MNHDDYAQLLGAYALHATEPDERAAIEAHLAECPKCRAEARDLETVATRLGNTGGEAPPEIWTRITQELDRPAPPLQLRLAQPVGRSRRVRHALTGLAAAAAVALGALSLETLHQAHRIDHLQSVATRAETDRAATGALARPGARQVALTSADGTTRVPAIIGRDGDAYLIASTLPGLSDDQTYQLWGQTSDGLISLGILGSRPTTEPFRIEPGVTALAVTAERAPGVAQSTKSPRVSAALT